ncbi:hypothetical protein ACFQ2B_39630 [Streptomyces stramineus]
MFRPPARTAKPSPPPWASSAPSTRSPAMPEARAMALTGTAPDLVAHTLDQAHDARAEAAPAEPATSHRHAVRPAMTVTG